MVEKKYLEFEEAVEAFANYLRKDSIRMRQTAETVLGRVQAADVRPALHDTPYMQEAVDRVIRERRRQIKLWGENSDNQAFEWMSILGEEFGELCEATNETFFKNGTHPERGGYEKIIKEAVEVAAVAVAIVESAAFCKEQEDGK